MKFIGMDAHSRRCVFVVLGKNGRVLGQATIKTQEDEGGQTIRHVCEKAPALTRDGQIN